MPCVEELSCLELGRCIDAVVGTDTSNRVVLPLFWKWQRSLSQAAPRLSSTRFEGNVLLSTSFTTTTARMKPSTTTTTTTTTTIVTVFESHGADHGFGSLLCCFLCPCRGAPQLRDTPTARSKLPGATACLFGCLNDFDWPSGDVGMSVLTTTQEFQQNRVHKDTHNHILPDRITDERGSSRKAEGTLGTKPSNSSEEKVRRIHAILMDAFLHPSIHSFLHPSIHSSLLSLPLVVE